LTHVTQTGLSGVIELHISMFTRGFYTRRSQKRKKTDGLTVFLRIWDMHV